MSDTPRSDELIERLGKTPFESLERMCVLDAIVRLCRQLERECNKSNSSQDTARLDWLEGEYERELKCTRTAMLPISIFRRNVPITRAMIDEAMAAEGHKPGTERDA